MFINYFIIIFRRLNKKIICSFSTVMDINELQEIYSSNIKRFRLRKGLKQDILAEKVDLSEKYISDLETGRRAGSFETLVSLANALEVEPYELLLPPQTSISYDTKRTKDLMNRLRKNLGDVVDTLEDFLGEK